MEVFGDLMIIVQTLIKISFAIAIEVMQYSQLIATCHVYLAAHDLQSSG